MARIAGIKLHKTTKGKIESVTIDLKKHGELFNPILEQIGAVEPVSDYDREFMEEFNKGLTKDQVLKAVIEHINTLPWKK